ncbi:NAD(P)H-binding protein [Herbiconiux sp. CPCC 203407]|uniref:NAD(P)H-binding protein n=1 Tax=Herbiconiux oxytropis TaxID=2970915 RepID=A0AA41XJD0_9MICO|nr:NAD(P)H-binding protein [Herbiconiux oxytropis]MCS5722393.1 NAD(P)H-binding protein [Herbiconiux oxytropis]MCS5727210.1 NAD(P)H-binding protein [Herbiconiux oxytropis]
MILVTGASGKLGRAILSTLSQRDVVATGTSRAARGDLRTLDFDDPESISLRGVDTLVLVSAGEAEDDVVVARHDAVITAAERDGVAHVVYTSLTSAGDHLGFALAHRWTERRLQQSTLSWTILRNGLYADLFGSLLGWSGNRLTSAFGDGALAAVSREDLAEAAAVVAEAPHRHEGRTYDLVGTPVTAADVAEHLGVPLVDVSLDHRRQELDRAGLKPFQPAMLMSIHTNVRHGFLGSPGPDLGHLLGREPGDTLADVAAATGAPRASTPSDATAR